MAPSKLKMPSRKPNVVLKPLPAPQDKLSDDFESVDSRDPMGKDETELELEKLVFGDEAGFHEGLRSHREGAFPTKLGVDTEDEEDTAQDKDQGLEGLDDGDVRTMAMLIDA